MWMEGDDGWRLRISTTYRHKNRHPQLSTNSEDDAEGKGVRTSRTRISSSWI